MEFQNPVPLHQIAKLISAKIVGNSQFMVLGINEIHRVRQGDIIFVDHPKYYEKALKCEASVVIINQEVDDNNGKQLLISSDPFRDFNLIISHFQIIDKPAELVSPLAEIHPTAHISPGVFVGQYVKIGAHTVIHPNVSLYPFTEIGQNVIIHSGTVIGADAFYYKKRPSGYDKLLSCGKVVIDHNVEIGANCTIDRGVSEITFIGSGTKIDDQVHIGHDTHIGKNCLFASQVGIAGCVTIEDNVTLWGQVGIASNIVLGKGAVVYAQSGTAKSLEPGKTYFGSPADEAKTKMRELHALKALPEIIKKLS